MEPCPASGADACEGGAVEGGADGGKTVAAGICLEIKEVAE